MQTHQLARIVDWFAESFGETVCTAAITQPQEQYLFN